MNKIGELKTIHYTDNINVFILNGIKVDIVNYPYPWLNPILKEENLNLADIKDISAMKLAAITGRGSKKDFVDIYFLLKHYSLEQMLGFYKQKYHDGSVFLVLKSLAYYEDADQEPMPKMLEEIKWETVKTEIAEKLKAFVNAWQTK